MQFVSFVASTMLIVLISQQSTMGLPINNTVVEESCSKGFEMVKGQCVPINSKLDAHEIESSSITPESKVVHEESFAVEDATVRSGACPEGMKHGEHGICQEIKFSETTEATIEVTTDLGKSLGREEHPKGCPEGTQPDEQGACQKIKFSETTEATIEVTTDLDKSLGGEEPPKGCPEGTQPDEQGACQETKPSNSTKMVTDPKFLLKKDGACPDNYKMIEGRCLYIKPKINPKLYSSYLAADDNVPNDLRPKNGVDDSVKFESVPVLSDNSCPEGTKYSEYGLCQKRILPLSTDVVMKADGHCPDNYELVNGICAPKKSKVQNLLDLTDKISKSESSTPEADPVKYDKLTKSTTEPTIVEESHSEVTFTPL